MEGERGESWFFGLDFGVGFASDEVNLTFLGGGGGRFFGGRLGQQANKGIF